jgi:hypothetical protein
MFARVLGGAVVLAMTVGIASGEEIRAQIKKVADGKVTFAKREGQGKDAKLGEDRTLPVAKDAKITKGKFSKVDDKFKVEAGEALAEGLGNKLFTEIGERGLPARIITDADNKTITEIIVFDFGGGKGKFKGKGKGKKKDA